MANIPFFLISVCRRLSAAGCVLSSSQQHVPAILCVAAWIWFLWRCAIRQREEEMDGACKIWLLRWENIIISFNFIYNVLQIKQRNLLMSDLSERPGTQNISKERLFLCHRSVTSAYHSPSSHFHLLARVHYSSEFLFLVMVCRSEDVPDSSLLRRNSVLPASQRYHRNATRRDQVSIWVRDPNMYQLVSLFSLNI